MGKIIGIVFVVIIIVVGILVATTIGTVKEGAEVYNTVSSVVNDDSINELSIRTFNTKFLSYEGSRVVGSNVKALISAVEVSNESGGSQIALECSGSDIEVGKTYSVSCVIGTDGYVSSIKIEEN